MFGDLDFGKVESIFSVFIFREVLKPSKGWCCFFWGAWILMISFIIPRDKNESFILHDLLLVQSFDVAKLGRCHTLTNPNTKLPEISGIGEVFHKT